jgi:Flp pilus assembly protein CpaB
LNKLMIVAGLVCGVLAALLVSQKLSEAEAKLASTQYLAYTSDANAEALFAGQALEELYLGTIEIPNSGDIFGLNARLIEDTPTNRTWIVGKKLNTTIPPGRVLTYNLFEDLEVERLDQIIPIGMRALSIQVSTSNSLNNRVVPGNRIDLIGVSEGSKDEEPVANVLLEDVKVIAVGKALSLDSLQSQNSQSYSTITVAVTPEEGKRMAVDRRISKGELILLLRNQCDTSSPNATCG